MDLWSEKNSWRIGWKAVGQEVEESAATGNG